MWGVGVRPLIARAVVYTRRGPSQFKVLAWCRASILPLVTSRWFGGWLWGQLDRQCPSCPHCQHLDSCLTGWGAGPALHVFSRANTLSSKVVSFLSVISCLSEIPLTSLRTSSEVRLIWLSWAWVSGGGVAGPGFSGNARAGFLPLACLSRMMRRHSLMSRKAIFLGLIGASLRRSSSSFSPYVNWVARTPSLW